MLPTNAIENVPHCPALSTSISQWSITTFFTHFGIFPKNSRLVRHLLRYEYIVAPDFSRFSQKLISQKLHLRKFWLSLPILLLLLLNTCISGFIIAARQIMEQTTNLCIASWHCLWPMLLRNMIELSLFIEVCSLCDVTRHAQRERPFSKAFRMALTATGDLPISDCCELVFFRCFEIQWTSWTWCQEKKEFETRWYGSIYLSRALSLYISLLED